MQLLTIEPEGIVQCSNKSVLVDLRETSQWNPTSVTIDIPDAIVSDSAKVVVACSGDLLGSCIQNLPNLINKPHSSGEQNMIDFVTNVTILNYLKNTNQLTPEIETRLKTNLEFSYQRQLRYRHHDGSFGVFGRKNCNGSTWITAYVVKSLFQATNYVSIESSVINQALDFLRKTQKDDGSFAENGNVFCTDLQGGSCKLALTAYVLTALVESKVSISSFCLSEK